MPYINNDGTRIFYLTDGNEEGSPLILFHGLTGSLEDFYEFKWVEGLRDEYHLIMMDARGHGHSDKPHDAKAYGFDLQVKDVVAVMDAVGVSKAHYLGFSMGGEIGFAMAKFAPERLLSLTIIGSHPYNRQEQLERWRSAFGQGMKAYLEKDVPTSPRLVATDWYMTRKLANDPEALILSGSAGDDLEGIIPNNEIPCLLYVGTSDNNFQHAKRLSEEMPNTQLYLLHDVAHGEAFRMTEVGIPRVKRFLSEVNRSLVSAGSL